jgi:hypothetical protein
MRSSIGIGTNLSFRHPQGAGSGSSIRPGMPMQEVAAMNLSGQWFLVERAVAAGQPGRRDRGSLPPTRDKAAAAESHAESQRGRHREARTPKHH